MKLDDVKNRKELVGAAMLAISVLSAVLIGAKVTGYFLASANAEEAIRQAIEQSKPDEKNVTVQIDKSMKLADALKSQNLFSPPEPRQNPVTAVMGVFGDEVLISGNWFKAGAKVGDATIISVAPTAVVVEWDGRTHVFNPIDGGSSSGPSRPSRSGRSKVASSARSGPKMVTTESAVGVKIPKGDNPIAKKMTKAFEKMSDSQKETFKKAMKKSEDRYEQMSSEEKTKFKTEMLKKIGGNGGKVRVELKAK